MTITKILPITRPQDKPIWFAIFDFTQDRNSIEAGSLAFTLLDGTPLEHAVYMDSNRFYKIKVALTGLVEEVQVTYKEKE